MKSNFTFMNDTSPISAGDDRKELAVKEQLESEAQTRCRIDEQLRKVGWEADTKKLRYSKGTRPIKGRCLAIAEWPTDSSAGSRGYADYALFIDKQMVAIIEAKAIHKDIPSVIDYQCKDYSRNIRGVDETYQMGTWGNYKVPFTFATNGRPYLEQYETKSGVWFLDLRRPENVPRTLKGWMSPIGMLELLEKDVAAGDQALQACYNIVDSMFVARIPDSGTVSHMGEYAVNALTKGGEGSGQREKPCILPSPRYRAQS